MKKKLLFKCTLNFILRRLLAFTFNDISGLNVNFDDKNRDASITFFNPGDWFNRLRNKTELG